jgi:predicted enzyme related to lactoylglutathione lyase
MGGIPGRTPINRPIHFEIPAEKPESDRVLRKVFGWKFERWNGPMEYWNISTGESEPGINGGLMTRRDPAQPCVNTMDVANLDETIKVIESAGGLCVVPKMPIPGVGWLAYFKDTEGHIFGVMQADTAAK